MAKYRKKTLTRALVIVDAIEFTDDSAKIIALGNFVDNGSNFMTISYADRSNPQLSIDTPDGGKVLANIGDYLVKSKDKSIQSVSAESFHENYVLVE